MLEKVKNAIRYERKIDTEYQDVWEILTDGHSFSEKSGFKFFWRIFWKAVFPFLITFFIAMTVTLATGSIFGIEELSITEQGESVMMPLSVVLFFLAIIASYIIVNTVPFIYNFTMYKPAILRLLILFVITAVLTFVVSSINYGIFAIIY